MLLMSQMQYLCGVTDGGIQQQKLGAMDLMATSHLTARSRASTAMCTIFHVPLTLISDAWI